MIDKTSRGVETVLVKLSNAIQVLRKKSTIFTNFAWSETIFGNQFSTTFTLVFTNDVDEIKLTLGTNQLDVPKEALADFILLEYIDQTRQDLPNHMILDIVKEGLQPAQFSTELAVHSARGVYRIYNKSSYPYGPYPKTSIVVLEYQNPDHVQFSTPSGLEFNQLAAIKKMQKLGLLN